MNIQKQLKNNHQLCTIHYKSAILTFFSRFLLFSGSPVFELYVEPKLFLKMTSKSPGLLIVLPPWVKKAFVICHIAIESDLKNTLCMVTGISKSDSEGTTLNGGPGIFKWVA